VVLIITVIFIMVDAGEKVYVLVKAAAVAIKGRAGRSFSDCIHLYGRRPELRYLYHRRRFGRTQDDDVVLLLLSLLDQSGKIKSNDDTTICGCGA
jgi:hypothetical protein